jgi:predicted molibdopterin-dependent oxidoreductase YjgC
MSEISAKTGISKDMIDAAIRVYGPAEHSSIVYGMDNVPEDLQKDCVYALSSLSLLTGSLGKPNSGIFPLKPGANSQGAWDVGCVPTHLPGFAPLEDDQARERVEEEWPSVIPPASGLGCQDILRPGRVKALFMVGDVAEPNSEAMTALNALDFLVVQDSFLGAAAQRAQVVLPRSSFAEKTGTYTNLERRIQSVRPVISPKNTSAKPESWTLCQLAQRMGAKGFDFSNTAAVMDEIASISTIYGGVSHRRLEDEGRLVFRPDVGNPLPTQVLYSDKEYHGIQWPCPNAESSGVEILFEDGFKEAKPQIRIPEFRRVELARDAAYPLLFTPGRVLLQSERKMTVIKGLSNRIEREEIIELHRDDGQVLGLREGDLVEVQTNGSSLTGRVSFKEGLQRGVVSSTQLFGQLMVEVEASQSPDPMSKIAGLNIAAARLVKVKS